MHKADILLQLSRSRLLRMVLSRKTGKLALARLKTDLLRRISRTLLCVDFALTTVLSSHTYIPSDGWFGAIADMRMMQFTCQSKNAMEN